MGVSLRGEGRAHRLRVRAVVDGVHCLAPVSCDAEISAFETRGRLQQAVPLLLEMRQSELESDVVSFSTERTSCEYGAQRQPAL